MGEGFEEFIRKNFRPLKVRGGPKCRIGRRTYDWLMKAEDRRGFSHLSIRRLDELAVKHELSSIAFDDGFVYIVKPDAERSVLADFQEQMEEMDFHGRPTGLKDAAPVMDFDLLENYRISEGAIFVLTGDVPGDLALTSDSVVDFITNDAIETALSNESVRMYYDEGKYVVVTVTEDLPSPETYPLHLERILTGTEISIDELTIEQKTAILGNYRDQVGVPKNDM